MNRQEVISIAAKLFCERGYNGTSIRDIARECGLTSSSLYSHVNSKEEILFEITLSGGQAFIDAIKPIAESSGDPIERIREAMFLHINLLVNHKEEAQVSLNEWKMLSQEKKEIVIVKRHEYEKYWLDIINDGIRKKLIKPENPDLVLVFILSVSNWVYQWYNSKGPYTLREIANIFTDKILFGIAT